MTWRPPQLAASFVLGPRAQRPPNPSWRTVAALIVVAIGAYLRDGDSMPEMCGVGRNKHRRPVGVFRRPMLRADGDAFRPSVRLVPDPCRRYGQERQETTRSWRKDFDSNFQAHLRRWRLGNRSALPQFRDGTDKVV
jgi:hypothetical protein